MNLLHMKYVSEIAKAGSMSKAADNLYMAQSNLSRAVKELEETLGITVFRRTSKGVVPTPEGAEFLQFANTILAQIDQVESYYQDRTAKTQRFSISVPRASYISDAFVQFSKAIDQSAPAELFYKETNALRAVKNLLEGDYRLGIVRYAENFDRYFREMLEEKELVRGLELSFRFVLLMSKYHPLTKKEEIRFDDLRSYTEIAHADPFVPNLSMSAVRKQELPDNILKRIYVFERSSQFELLNENTDTFMWVSAIPQKLMDRYGLVQRVCRDNERRYKDVLIYRKGYRLTELDHLFINELKNARRRIDDEE